MSDHLKLALIDVFETCPFPVEDYNQAKAVVVELKERYYQGHHSLSKTLAAGINISPSRLSLWIADSPQLRSGAKIVLTKRLIEFLNRPMQEYLLEEDENPKEEDED